jgi:acetoin utilization deacetylase AcuC-like enzyme
VLYVHHPSSLAHDPRALSPAHPDSPARIEAIDAAIDASTLDPLERLIAPAATKAELLLVHTAEHVEAIGSLCEAGGGRIDEDTFVGPASYGAALHSAGGACAMVRALLDGRVSRGFSALRPAGHHAEQGRAMGFCLFNNVAIAAELAVRELEVQRVMIIDWDVHHCNGTAEIFRQRPDVLVVSIHQQGLYPGTGALTDGGSGPGSGYTVNIPVPRGSDEEVWLSVLEHLVVPIGLEYRPELVLVSAGYDAHRHDPLSDCMLNAGSFGALACLVRDLAADLDVPLGAVLEGGYDLAALGRSVVATLAAFQDRGESDSIAPDQIVTPRVASHLGHAWAL